MSINEVRYTILLLIKYKNNWNQYLQQKNYYANTIYRSYRSISAPSSNTSLTFALRSTPLCRHCLSILASSYRVPPLPLVQQDSSDTSFPCFIKISLSYPLTQLVPLHSASPRLTPSHTPLFYHSWGILPFRLVVLITNRLSPPHNLSSLDLDRLASHPASQQSESADDKQLLPRLLKRETVQASRSFFAFSVYLFLSLLLHRCNVKCCFRHILTH